MKDEQPTRSPIDEEIARLRAELEQVRHERDELFCDAHRPNASKKYVGCLVCSRNEDYQLVCDFLKALGWTRDKESGFWARDSEEGAVFSASSAVVKAIEDHDGLRAAHRKACLYAVSQYNRAEASESREKRVREALEKMRREMHLHEVTLSAAYTYLQGQPEPLPQQLSNSVAEAIEACEKSYEIIERALEGE